MSRAREHGAWVLLELLLALTIFVFAAIAVLGAVSQGIAGAERTRDRAKAVDLARSTMARLEAGLGTVQSLAGPVPAWEPEMNPGSQPGQFDAAPSDMPAPPSLWEVEIDTIASEFPGLTHVTVTAVKRAAPESERLAASFSFHQLVRIGPELDDSVGEIDRLGGLAPPRDAPSNGGGGP